MLNHAPIFLFCFSRGGSNIFWNLFLSHPEVCSPILETLVIFSVKPQHLTRTGLQASWRTKQWRYFDNWYLNERRPIGTAAEHYIDKVLYEWKLKTIDDQDMQYKREDVRYTLDEVRQARLVTKNNNGLLFLSKAFEKMYSDATFFALTREPVALYESHKRRGITKSPTEFATFYNTIAQRMLTDSQQMSRYHLVRFEDVLASPQDVVLRLYEQAGLDTEQVTKIRLKAKPHIQQAGDYGTNYKKGQHYWLDIAELQTFLEPNINHLQRDRITSAEQQSVLEQTEAVRKQLGY